MEKLQNSSSHQIEQEKRIETLELENAKLQAKVTWLEEQFRLMAQRKFGTSSEKAPEGQVVWNLFNEMEECAAPQVEETEKEPNTAASQKNRKPRTSLDQNLPVTVVSYSLPEEERACSSCGKQTHVMTVETRREITIIPATVEVTEHRREIYACRTCEREGIETPIIKAPAPNPVLPKSMASPSALAYVLTQKFHAGLPLYRLEEQFSQLGASLSRQTLSNWVIAATEKWVTPLYELMKKYLLNETALHADETTVQVLNEDGRKATSKSYMWLYRSISQSQPCILYDYQTTRSAKHVKKFLEDFTGVLHTDGYGGYEGIPGVTLSGCWAHARRKFVEAGHSVAPKKGTGGTITEEAIARIAALYKVEKEITELENENGYDAHIRLKIREEKSLPLVKAFFAWVKNVQPQVLKKSPLGVAITYALNQEKKLMQPFLDGRLDIDNNLAERSIKPFVIGRKNWLFSKTPKGATASAMAYSLIVTAKENDLNVFNYLTHLFTSLPNIDVQDEETLSQYLPWSPDLPENCTLQNETS